MAAKETAGQKISQVINQNRDRVEEQLMDRANSMINDLTLLVTALEDDQHINGLGVLQSRGSELDRLCGMREQIVELQNSANYHNEREEADDEDGSGLADRLIARDNKRAELRAKREAKKAADESGLSEDELEFRQADDSIGNEFTS